MKVEIKEKEHDFKPIKLEITIESKEEIDTLKTLSLINISIPELVSDAGGDDGICKMFLDKFFNTLKNK